MHYRGHDNLLSLKLLLPDIGTRCLDVQKAGMGVTKPISLVPLFFQFYKIIKILLISELRWHLANMNELNMNELKNLTNAFAWSKIFLTGKLTNGPDSKVHGANMGRTWVLSAPDGPHVGPHEPCYKGGLDSE